MYMICFFCLSLSKQHVVLLIHSLYDLQMSFSCVRLFFCALMFGVFDSFVMTLLVRLLHVFFAKLWLEKLWCWDKCLKCQFLLKQHTSCSCFSTILACCLLTQSLYCLVRSFSCVGLFFDVTWHCELIIPTSSALLVRLLLVFCKTLTSKVMMLVSSAQNGRS